MLQYCVMKTLYKKKAIALYETRMRVSYVIITVVFYILAAILWYALEAVAPYTVTVTVDPNERVLLTREALSATEEQKNKSVFEKEHALLMPTSESSYARRLKLIEDAKHSIDYMVYDSYEEDYTFYYYTALFRAADRGVKVRIVLDGKMGKLNGALSDIGDVIASHENIELYYFNGVNVLDPAGLMVMMHDKVTIVDGETMIVGGVNMGRAAFLSNYDMEVMITNSGENGSVGQAETYFEKVISHDVSKRIKAKSYNAALKKKYNDDYAAFYAGTEFANATVDYKMQGVPVDRVTFMANKITTGKKSPVVWQMLYNFMETSKTSTIVTPYILLQNDKKADIKRLAKRNDSFTVITNSLYNTRNVAYADYYYTRDEYLTNDIKLLEFQAQDQLHAKMFSFDDRYSIIGSYNLDERSIHIDTESVLVIDSPQFNKILNNYIEEQFVNQSLRVGTDNKYIGSDTVQDHEIPASKRFKYALYRVLSVVRCLI